MNISLTSALRRFVDEQVKSGRCMDGSDVVRAALRHLEAQERYVRGQTELVSLGATGDGDIKALAFIVMMEAAKSAQEDLKAIMTGVKAINTAKQGWRDLVDKANRDAAANASCRSEAQVLGFSKGMGTERGYHRVPMPV